MEVAFTSWDHEVNEGMEARSSFGTHSNRILMLQKSIKQIWWLPHMWTQGESPPSFCNGLGTIYIVSSRGRTVDLTTRDMGSKFRYILRKVLGTQDYPTLRLASHHCVLRLNLIKNMFNTCIYTHTHTSIHLSIQHEIIIPKDILIYL